MGFSDWRHPGYPQDTGCDCLVSNTVYALALVRQEIVFIQDFICLLSHFVDVVL